MAWSAWPKRSRRKRSFSGSRIWKKPSLFARRDYRIRLSSLGQPCPANERPSSRADSSRPSRRSKKRKSLISLRACRPINFKVDTGMGRMGVPEAQWLAAFQASVGLAKSAGSTACRPTCRSRTRMRITRATSSLRFRNVVEQFRAEVPGEYKAHVCKAPARLRSMIHLSRSFAPGSCSTAFRRCRNFRNFCARP